MTAAEIKAHRLMTLELLGSSTGRCGQVDIGTIKVVGAAMLHNAIDRAIQVWAARCDRGPSLEAMYRQARWLGWSTGRRSAQVQWPIALGSFVRRPPSGETRG